MIMVGVWVAGGVLAATSTALCGLVVWEWAVDRFGPDRSDDGGEW